MKYKQVRSIVVVGCITASTACQTTSYAADNAVLIAPSSETIRLLEDAIAPFFNGRRIALSKTTFVNSSELVIDLNRLNSHGQPKNDLDATRPTSPQGDRFWLRKRGAQCVLEHEQTSKRVDLPGVNCKLKPN